MASIVINTDGTVENTKLVVDGKDITDSEKVTDISLHCSAPFMSKYGNGLIDGDVFLSYELVKDDGTFERKQIGKCDTDYKGGIGSKVENSDSVIRHIGHSVDQKIEDIVSKIIAKYVADGKQAPSRDSLINRSYDSLRDKAIDLGIELTD